MRFVLLLMAVATGLPAQSRSGPRRVLPRDHEIALARSAAPPSVSAAATVWVFADSAFVVASRGTNGVNCYVDRSWPASIEPHCHDAEGSATILPMHMRRTLLLHQGRSESEADREIADGLLRGVYRLPRRPAMSYMMSEAQELIGDDGKPAGNWRPHLMIYYPFLTDADVGLGNTPDMRVGMISDAGKPTANIMIVMPGFVKVSPGK